MFNRLASIQPQDPNSYVNVGAALYMMGRLNESVGMFDRALALDPSLETARQNRDAVRRRLRDEKESGQR